MILPYSDRAMNIAMNLQEGEAVYGIREDWSSFENNFVKLGAIADGGWRRFVDECQLSRSSFRQF